MANQRSISAFDVIGPVMVGPSSSHTAGAVRLGQIGRSMLGTTPQKAIIGLHGSFASTGSGHGTDKAIVAGLLGLSTSDERIRTSFSLAQQAGMRVEFQEINLGEEAHPNTARLTLTSHELMIRLTGSSIGGGMVEVTELQGYPVRFTAELNTMVIIADDQPGTINAVSGWLAAHQINIAYLRVKRDQRGGDAIMIIETDQLVPSSVVDSMKNLPWAHWVRQIPRLSE